jgi:hypothetical protein
MLEKDLIIFETVLLLEFHILSVLKKGPNFANYCSFYFANIASAGF